jgi:hypothetical protein
MKMTKNAKTKRLSALAGDATSNRLERLDAGQGLWTAASTPAAAGKSQKAMSQGVGFTDSEDGLSAPAWSSTRNTDRFERFSNGTWNYRAYLVP